MAALAFQRYEKYGVTVFSEGSSDRTQIPEALTRQERDGIEACEPVSRLGMPRNSTRVVPGWAKSSATLNQIVLRVLASN